MQDAIMNVISVFLFIYSLIAIVNGYIECKRNKNAFGESKLYIPLGAWVWGDVFILGIFWLLTSIFLFIYWDLNLFILFVSVFWVIRSFGEFTYWLNQQFSTVMRNPPKNLLFHNIFHNDSIWFIYQIIWQCLTVVAIISSIYFADKWLN